MTEESKRALKCLGPAGGIFLGFIMGWILYFTLPHSLAMDTAARFYSLLFGLLGWAFAVLIQGKKLYCGGTELADEESRSKHLLYVIVVLLGTAVITLFIAKEWLTQYFLVVAIIGAILVGEIGWGKPFKAMETILPKDSK